MLGAHLGQSEGPMTVTWRCRGWSRDKNGQKKLHELNARIVHYRAEIPTTSDVFEDLTRSSYDAEGHEGHSWPK